MPNRMELNKLMTIQPPLCSLLFNVRQILRVFFLIIPERMTVREDLRGGKGAKCGGQWMKALMEYYIEPTLC